MDTISFISIAVDCPSAALITLHTGKAPLETLCTGPYVIVTDCSLSLTTAMIQIPAWAYGKFASDFWSGSGFGQVNIYNKEVKGKIILKKGKWVAQTKWEKRKSQDAEIYTI